VLSQNGIVTGSRYRPSRKSTEYGILKNFKYTNDGPNDTKVLHARWENTEQHHDTEPKQLYSNKRHCIKSRNYSATKC